MFNATRYGASTSPAADSGPGIQAAISAAQAAGGGEVYLPTGTYLDENGASLDIPTGPAVTISGAGRDQTTVVEGSPGKQLLHVDADHSVVENITLDAEQHGGGPCFTTSANDVTLQHARVLGARGGSWPVRFAGGKGTATPQHPTYSTGNAVDDLILHDTAPGKDDGLDFSFQEAGTITDVQHTGSRLGLYVDHDVTVTDYTFTPDPAVPTGAFGFYITAPGDNITIANFTSSGEGGKIGVIPPGSPRQASSNITIQNERMTGGGTYQLSIGDVTNLVIENSSLAEVFVAPNVRAQISIRNSTEQSLIRRPAAGASLDLRS